MFAPNSTTYDVLNHWQKELYDLFIQVGQVRIETPYRELYGISTLFYNFTNDNSLRCHVSARNGFATVTTPIGIFKAIRFLTANSIRTDAVILEFFKADSRWCPTPMRNPPMQNFWPEYAKALEKNDTDTLLKYNSMTIIEPPINFLPGLGGYGYSASCTNVALRFLHFHELCHIAGFHFTITKDADRFELFKQEVQKEAQKVKHHFGAPGIIEKIFPDLKDLGIDTNYEVDCLEANEVFEIFANIAAARIVLMLHEERLAFVVEALKDEREKLMWALHMHELILAYGIIIPLYIMDNQYSKAGDLRASRATLTCVRLILCMRIGQMQDDGFDAIGNNILWIWNMAEGWCRSFFHLEENRSVRSHSRRVQMEAAQNVLKTYPKLLQYGAVDAEAARSIVYEIQMWNKWVESGMERFVELARRARDK